MKCFVGIDLGSTTTKAIYIDENENILGRGIINSRSNYNLACQIAEERALNDARFAILEKKLTENLECDKKSSSLMPWILNKYKLAEHYAELDELHRACLDTVDSFKDQEKAIIYRETVDKILVMMKDEAKSQHESKEVDVFFRDIATSSFLAHAEDLAYESPIISFEKLVSIFDRAILLVESINFSKAFSKYIDFASQKTAEIKEFSEFKDEIRRSSEYAAKVEFDKQNTIGTGYGRQRLPFDKKQLRSEILCHGLGAHYMFPKTTTVLDIGGQDTKAIQLDSNGLVVNFQMNDRCAAGCGRYLGYVADEMNMGVHDLGPHALTAKKSIRINSTCTVFAGSEIRNHLSLGEKREEILLGLHRSIILRALSLLARSGGIFDEFTFTGGVSKNQAATKVLQDLVLENYGKIKINISPDSIYAGALGASLFAQKR